MQTNNNNKATERAEAIARLNARQQARNVYTNIGNREVTARDPSLS